MKILLNNIKIVIYVALVIMISYIGTVEYLQWLNPYDMKVEENPKQHDGSQEFKRPIDWESSIEPAPDGNGVRRYLPPDKLEQHGSEDIIYTPQTLEFDTVE